jgi:putative transposase
MKINFMLVKIFHSDRGSEFNNFEIDKLLTLHEITRSLSKCGNPIDNAVVESTYNIIKTELVKQNKFDSLENFELEWFDYLNWYNNHRIHGSIGYVAPRQKTVRENVPKKGCLIKMRRIHRFRRFRDRH